jgi:acyl carrier protein
VSPRDLEGDRSRVASSFGRKGVDAVSRELVRQAFVDALDLPPETDIEALEIGKSPNWDSMGHMALAAELEDRFGIELDTDDLVEMSSFSKSLEILRRYGVAV